LTRIGSHAQPHVGGRNENPGLEQRSSLPTAGGHLEGEHSDTTRVLGGESVREARQSAAEEKKKRNVELEKQRGRW
jgi:hypothetical protein